MLLKEILDKIFQEDYLLTKTDLGLSNDIYHLKTKDEAYMVRVPKSDISIFLNPEVERAIQKKIKPLNLDFKEYYYDEKTHIRITYYVDNLKEFKDFNAKDKYFRALDMIHKFHTLDFVCDHHFDLIEKYFDFKRHIKKERTDYSRLEKILKDYKALEFEEVLCHNDLVSGNILFGKQDYLIDYEYAAMNHPYFDLMSFITENQINDPNLREELYEYYFKRPITKEERKTLQTIENAQNLLWAAWANMLYDSRKEVVYLEIFHDKLKHLI